MTGRLGQRRFTALYILAAFATVACALAVVLLSPQILPPRSAQGAAEASLELSVAVSGAEHVEAVREDEEAFAAAFGAYLRETGAPLGPVRVLPDPQGANDVFYASCEGRLYQAAVREGAAAKYAFAACGEGVEGIDVEVEYAKEGKEGDR